MHNGKKQAIPAHLLLTDKHRAVDYAKLLHAHAHIPLLIIIRHTEKLAQQTLVHNIKPHLTRKHTLSMANNVELARKNKIQFLHLSEAQIRQRGTLNTPLLRRRFKITAAAHSFAALKRAEAIGACAVLLSPVFQTASHLNEKKPLGVYPYRALARKRALKIYPLGGMNSALLKYLSTALSKKDKKNVAGLAFYLQNNTK